MSETGTIAVAAPHARRVLGLNRRQRTLLAIVIMLGLIGGAVIGGQLLGEAGLSTDLAARNQAPSLDHPFGTDWLGRDMLTRTLRGLTMSLVVGVAAASMAALVALGLGTAAATLGGAVDAAVSWLIDLALSVPHLVALILIAFAMGGGVRGVVIGIVLTHWPRLARVVRAEVLALRHSEFVQVSARMGRSRLWVAGRHMLPHVVPHFMVGLILLFPHAILHEAAISFLGFGLSPHRPAIGIILSESMQHLSMGRWWLAVLPGISLLVMVRAFDVLGDNVRSLIDPRTAHE